MDNQIKNHIDSIKRKRMKTELQLSPEDEKARVKKAFESEYEYTTWTLKTISTEGVKTPFPKNADEIDLYELLTLNIFHKQALKSACDKRSLKSACDAQHPLIFELLIDMNMSDTQAKTCVQKIQQIDPDPLNYFLLFGGEITGNNTSQGEINNVVDQLAEDCSQGTVISHSAKMTHPSCKYPRIFSAGTYQKDGFVRTGNSSVSFDMHINATKLKVFKFLSLKHDGKHLLDHVKDKNNGIFQHLFNVTEDRADKWIQMFSLCLKNQDYRTNSLIKQTYFPTSTEYHLLSLLHPSGIVFLLKDKIDRINNYSPESYAGKKCKKNGLFFDRIFSTISNLTETRHGGDHPKNISALNNKHQSHYLLSSLPPNIENRKVHFPKTNFFHESLRYYEYRDIFEALHKIFKTDYNNVNIREGRDYRLQELLDRIIDRMWAVRSIAQKQYHSDSSQLQKHQNIWLCEESSQERNETDQWLEKLCKEITIWIIRSYEKAMGKQAIKLGEAERVKIVEIINHNKEGLR